MAAASKATHRVDAVAHGSIQLQLLLIDCFHLVVQQVFTIMHVHTTATFLQCAQHTQCGQYKFGGLKIRKRRTIASKSAPTARMRPSASALSTSRPKQTVCGTTATAQSGKNKPSKCCKADLSTAHPCASRRRHHATTARETTP